MADSGKALLEEVDSIAREAGAAISGVYARDLPHNEKRISHG